MVRSELHTIFIRDNRLCCNRAFDEAKTVLPAEVARGVYIENPPEAEALKLMHLLIGKAGGRMAEDVRHELRLADIKKKSRGCAITPAPPCASSCDVAPFVRLSCARHAIKRQAGAKYS